MKDKKEKMLIEQLNKLGEHLGVCSKILDDMDFKGRDIWLSKAFPNLDDRIDVSNRLFRLKNKFDAVEVFYEEVHDLFFQCLNRREAMIMRKKQEEDRQK